MSVRVLQTNIGVRYIHRFMDDLESFFWLLVWSVAGHLNSREKTASLQALQTLRKLDDDDLDDIASFKSMLLMQCSLNRGRNMLDRLKSFENDWATHESVTSLVLTMGKYFYDEVYSDEDLIHDPSVVFPKIVNMILDKLARGPSE